MRLPRQAPQIDDLVGPLRSDELMAVWEQLPTLFSRDKYLHWDELVHRKAPEGLTHEQWWLGLKFARSSQTSTLPLTDSDNRPFSYSVPEQAQRILHELAMRAGGTIGVPDLVTDPTTRREHLMRNLMEEGIASSLLEGASTTREKAKEVIRSKQKPLTEGDMMAVNNYRAMQFITDLGKKKLTPELVFRLHEILSDGTMDPKDIGRLRRPDEPVEVVDGRDNQVLHVPPPADHLERRMEAMCTFANEIESTRFVHPVIRSILLHFWLAYDHPFKDGNGRCARALFYWSMLQHDYWLCRYFSISQVICNAPVKYARAFLLTETDGNDATYFLLHQLGVIERAIAELDSYLGRKVAARTAVELRIKETAAFSERQLDAIAHALRHPKARYTIQQHQTTHDVVYQTARTDMLGLANRGLLIKRKIGRTFYFSPAPDLDERLEEL